MPKKSTILFKKYGVATLGNLWITRLSFVIYMSCMTGCFCKMNQGQWYHFQYLQEITVKSQTPGRIIYPD